MEFYNRNWTFMGTKEDLEDDLQQATGIDKRYLTTGRKFKEEASVATRMSWMVGRITTQVEDIAYSMLGILDINMTPQYGEGVTAFTRLQRTLIESSTDESVFAWKIPKEGLKCYSRRRKEWDTDSWGLLAPSHDCFKDSGDLVIPPEDKVEARLGGGYRWTQQGVQFEEPQKSGTDITNWLGLPRKEIKFALNCWKYEKDGKPSTIIIHLLKDGDVYKRVQCHDLDLKKDAKPSNNRVLGIEQVITRSLTVKQPSFV